MVEVNKLTVGSIIETILGDKQMVCDINEERDWFELKWILEDGTLSVGSEFYVPSHFSDCKLVCY